MTLTLISSIDSRGPARVAGAPVLRVHEPARGAETLNRFAYSLPTPLRMALTQRLAMARRAHWTERLWRADATLWTGADEGNWLGWLTSLRRPQRLTRELAARCAALCGQGATDAVLLGMGGASLGAEVLVDIVGKAAKGMRVHVLDTTDSAQIRAVAQRIELRCTLFIVASKSGTTIESRMLADYFHERLCAELGEAEAGKRFIAITDPGTPLETHARERGYAAVFQGEPTVGGRNSVLTPFGLVTLGLLGHDPAEFLKAARPMLRACALRDPESNPGLFLGALVGEAALCGRDKATILATPGLAPFGAWLEQLLAESTGKYGRGVIPVDREPAGEREDYGEDRLFIALIEPGEAGLAVRSRAIRLAEAGHPVVLFELADPARLGQEFLRWEVATAIAGAILGVNPFDQPDVEAAKQRARALTEKWRTDGALPVAEPMLREGQLRFYGMPTGAGSAAELLAHHFVALRGRGYGAVLAYIARSRANEARLEQLRRLLRDASGCATVGGFGPRYLHSSGQLHKGGPAGGVFLLITADTKPEVIEGQGLDFGVIQAAQAQGDFEELRARGRPCVRVHIEGDLHSGLAQLAHALHEGLSQSWHRAAEAHA
ncbi:hypothetical protein CEK29_10745 [Bordetella genomosp. 5]|uniref:hypothetical protein n=1 Tax=Bordetella genomosp. 5 TaxID=1395608 RepID=UPI000B9E7D96|nr:hypothetical protein [Bordetella genomosp. 5]OZI43616.1 hypothetical protein CEK29_10745 [Bordetella genomosp. 5]